MDIPPLSEHHQKLAKLTGSWQGTEKMPPSEWVPQGAACEVTTTSRLDLNGFVVITDYQQSNAGETTYAGHGVYSIDRDTNGLLLHWFDSMGSPAELFFGQWHDDVLVLESKNSVGHNMRLTHDYSIAGSLSSSGEMSQDGNSWVPMFQGTYTRQNDQSL